jgi:hypothetical protein
MYTDPTPLSLRSYNSNDGFDMYARTEYSHDSIDTQHSIALKLRMENTPQTKFPVASFSLLCLVGVIVTSLTIL